MLKWLINLIYPRRAVCMGCGAATGCEEDWICPKCREELDRNLAEHRTLPEGFENAGFAHAYRGAVAGLVRHLKYSGIQKLADFMAADMTQVFRSLACERPDCVTAVPMHVKRRRQRGYNHAELLARSVAVRLSIPYEDLLDRVRDTAQQARLSDEERLKNMMDAFTARPNAEGRRVLLIDDVCTTGSTARACAKALNDAGALSVVLLCYAAAVMKK